MNAVPSPPAPWTQRRWLCTIGLVFLAHVSLVIFFGARPGKPLRPVSFRTAIYLAMNGHGSPELPTLADPTLFALPHHQGFSGEAWLKFDPLQHQWTDWIEPPRWLALEMDLLGKTYSAFQATNIAAPLLVADKPLPPLMRSTPNVSALSVAGRSEWRMEGDLASRPLLTPFDLRSWSHTDILTNSVVQLLVDAEGNPVSTALLAPSGSIHADQHALKLARTARFQPSQKSPLSALQHSGGALTWGKLIFQWHTLAAHATNLSTAKP